MQKKNKKKPSKKEKESVYLELKGFLTFLILHELKQNKLCGDELAVKIGQRKGTTLTPGTIYPTLKRLRRQKLIAYRKHGRKKTYELTNQGKKEINRLYKLFSKYFYGLKGFIKRQK